MRRGARSFLFSYFYIYRVTWIDTGVARYRVLPPPVTFVTHKKHTLSAAVSHFDDVCVRETCTVYFIYTFV